MASFSGVRMVEAMLAAEAEWLPQFPAAARRAARA
jgi:hypothetical protein